jgi:hypothetical protein
VLLRESYRENGKAKTRTLANLSRWPEHKVEKLQTRRPGHGAQILAGSSFRGWRHPVNRLRRR